MKDIRMEPWVCETLQLPSIRNEEKDTIHHLWNMLHKIPCLAEGVRFNPFQTDFFAYIDFHSPTFFRDKRTVRFLKEHFGKGTHLFCTSKEIQIPGCWSKYIEGDIRNQIHWRFCGAFVFGPSRAILEFEEIYKQHFHSFFKEILTWEVNYWAWLETHTHWKPQWYQADHNDTLVRVPNVFGFHIFGSPDKINRYSYPDLSPYRPMSASITNYQGHKILNTRYVNYWIFDNGAYWYPEDEHKIRTKNICSVLDSSLHPVCYIETENPSLPKRTGVFSEGVEDIRLFVSKETGELMFIGSTLEYSYMDKIRMMVGKYAIEWPEDEVELVLESDTSVSSHSSPLSVSLTNCKLLVPPSDTWCEKNWAHIPFGERDGFIYKWHPMLEIGVLDSSSDSDSRSPPLAKLTIVHTSLTNTEIFRTMKGSTSFVSWNAQWIGLVHFSEDVTPREYYHRLVVLDDMYKVAKISESFCFFKRGVEFCMGMDILGQTFVFWISQKDREPAMIEIAENWFEGKWICF